MTSQTVSITAPLERKFEKHRVVFWYDDIAEMRKDFDAVDLVGVEKIEIDNNEFGLKYRILREQPDQKFLVYKASPQPADPDNWLLDIQLAGDTFHTDSISQTLDELELPSEFRQLVVGHSFFFNADKRKSALQRLLKSDDTENQVRMKMLAVCVGSDARLDSVLENMLSELADASGKSERMNLVAKCELDDFLWDQLRREFKYDNQKPSLKDFVIELFKSCYAMETGGTVSLSSESVVFLRRWMDSFTHRTAFETHSEECAEILRIADHLHDQDIKQLIELDFFKLIDQKIISDLSRAVMVQTISAGECKQIIRRRKNTHWYAEYADIYETIEHGTRFLSLLNNVEINLVSLAQGVASYVQSYYQIDQEYRKFVYFYKRSGNKKLFGSLFEQICNEYTNNFLLKLGDSWQTLVDESDAWKIPDSLPQKQFFSHFVHGKFLGKKRKVHVIISDALRYEAGEELCNLIKQEDKFDAKLSHMITGLPSYTQLGMASLLPNSSLEIQDNKGSGVAVDGVNSGGIPNRDKILKNATDNRGLAILAKDLMDLSSIECKQLVADHDVIYVYHDRIDNTGHKQKTEREAFVATETAFDELMKIIRHLTSGNATNLIVTSDHGFLYQDDVSESDYSSANPNGDELCNIDRRFVVGRGLSQEDGTKRYDADSLGLAGELQVVIPKSINRFRRQGASTRFVHGGCTLQEIVVPVIQVHKGRTSDQAVVEVNLISGGTNVISAGQLAVNVYQAEPISDKIRPRYLRFGLYASDGTLISDSHDLTFDFESENAREREQKLRLVLSKQSDSYNEQQVTLRMDEPVGGTNHFSEYKSIHYTLRRLFTSDFDL